MNKEVFNVIKKFKENLLQIRKKLKLKKKYDYEMVNKKYIAIKHRLELFFFIFNIIEKFNWNNYHFFNQGFLKSEIINSNNNYLFECDRMSIDFKTPNAMINFIHIMLMSYFSTCISIFENFSSFFWKALNIDIRTRENKIIEDERFITIKRIAYSIYNGKKYNKNIKGILYNNFLYEGCWFENLKKIRNKCEHGNHNQIFIWENKDSSLGSRPEGIPFIDERLFSNSKINDPDEIRVDIYCKKILNKTRGFLLSLFLEIDLMIRNNKK